MKTQVVHQQYLTTQVATADRLQLVVMLYEGAIGFLKQARERLTARDAAGKGHYLGKTLDILAELNASLNFAEGGEIAANLFHLYNFMIQHLTRANLSWDGEAVEQVIDMLTKLKESWEEVSQRARKGELAALPEGPAPGAKPSLGSLVV